MLRKAEMIKTMHRLHRKYSCKTLIKVKDVKAGRKKDRQASEAKDLPRVLVAKGILCLWIMKQYVTHKESWCQKTSGRSSSS